jgi:hypothetical protein
MTIIAEIVWTGCILSNANRKYTTTIDRISWNLFLNQCYFLFYLQIWTECNNPVTSGRNLFLIVSFCDNFKIHNNRHLKHVCVWIFYYIKDLSFSSRENYLQKWINFYLLFLITSLCPPAYNIKIHFPYHCFTMSILLSILQYCLKIYPPLLEQKKKLNLILPRKLKIQVLQIQICWYAIAEMLFMFTATVYIFPHRLWCNIGYNKNSGLLKMIVGVLTTCHTQYTWDRSI